MYGTLYKLPHLKISRFLPIVIKNFFKNRKFQIRINVKITNPFTPKQGISQRSPLSPILYNIYCTDIFEPRIPGSKQYILQYADDTMILSHNENIRGRIEKLQELMNKTELWCCIWRLKPNPQKSEFIIFENRPSMNSQSIEVCGERKVVQQSIKYIQIDQRMNCNQHTNSMKKKAIAQAKYFSGMVIRNQGLQ